MKQAAVSKLIVRSPGGHSYEVPLPRGSTTIGRGPDCDVVLHDDSVSRRHARVEARGGRFVLVDEGSTNGTYVGETRIADSRVLSEGDEITIGNTHLLYVKATSGQSTTKPLKSPAEGRSPSLVRVDVRAREVWVKGKKLDTRFAPLEFKLLAYLYCHAHAVCTREELGIELWGDDATHEMLHQLVHRLKRRLEPAPGNPRYIVTVPGVGYRLLCREGASIDEH